MIEGGYAVNLFQIGLRKVVHNNQCNRHFRFKHIVCNVVIIEGKYLKVVNLRFIAFFHQHRFLVNKSPRAIAIRVVVKRKLLLHTVFLIDKSNGILVRLSIVGYLHQFRDIVANLIGTEVQ